MVPNKIKSLLTKNKTPEQLNEHYTEMEKLELEKGDFLAMVIAALITFLPVMLIIIAVLFGVIWLMFGRVF